MKTVAVTLGEYEKPERCPECTSRFRETTTEYGILRQCVGCTVRQWCGLDGKPFGTPANVFVRRARQRAHEAFDPIWKNGHMGRAQAYEWLAEQLGHTGAVHMGELNTEDCLRVVALSKTELDARRKMIRRGPQL